MTRKLVSGMLLLLLLVGMIAFVFKIEPARAWSGGAIYIRADGSIEPFDAPVTRNGDFYTLISNITSDADGIIIERNNMTLDGADYTVQGTGPWESGFNGISLSGRANVTVQNTNIKNFHTGILGYESSSDKINGNNIANNSYGVWLRYSSYNSISGNNITANSYYGVYLRYSLYNSVSGNNIANNSYGVWLTAYSLYNSVSGNNITTNNSYGIYLCAYSSNNSVSGNNITANSYYGIGLDNYSNKNAISGNTIANNSYGIYLYFSSNISILANVFRDNGLDVCESYGNVVEGNLVNDKPLVYLEGVSDFTIENAGQVILINCDGIVVENLNLSYTDVGIELLYTKNTKITNNNITANNSYGIYLHYSSYNSISGNNITANNAWGIELWASSYNSVSENNIANNEIGIRLVECSGNSVSGNNITNNDIGIYLYYYSSYNSIYRNDFIDNIHQAYSWKSVNLWDYGYPSGGNYWSDYTGQDLDGDGIGDTPYIIDADNQDNYPLMLPWGTGDINKDCKVSLKDLVLLAKAYDSEPGDPNWNLNADLDNNGVIGLSDLDLLAKCYGKIYE